MKPIKIFDLVPYTAQECSFNGTVDNRFSGFRLFDIKFDDLMAPLMVFTSFDEILRTLAVEPQTWSACVKGLKGLIEKVLGEKEPLIFLSHVNVPYFDYRDFARIMRAKVRSTEIDTKELSLKNPAAIDFFTHYPRTNKQLRRFSAVLSFRKIMSYTMPDPEDTTGESSDNNNNEERPKKMDIPQPRRAHQSPDGVYLDFPGTQQRYLKWRGGYSPFYPSYTEIELNKKHLVGSETTSGNECPERR